MAKIISESKHIKETVHSYEFDIDENGGFSFPCDENGIINFPSLHEEAKQNLIFCLNNTSKFRYVGKRSHIIEYTDPAIMECDCGANFTLVNEYHGACECPDCGQWYNLFGQKLENPQIWNKEY